MANVYLENWIKKAELDFFTMFIKSWLPFNAWYMKDFYDETANRTTDRSIIDHLKNNSNRYKNKIIALLRGSDDESLKFRSNLGLLHFELEAHPIPDPDDQISFNNTSIVRNILLQKVVSFGHYDYKVEFRNTLPKTQKRWICSIISRRTSLTIHLVELFNWSLTELHSNVDYIAIPSEKKQYLDGCFLDMNPKKPELIIVPPERVGAGYRQPSRSIAIDEKRHLYFIDDYELVSKVIIEVLYALRCQLFHGELDPIIANIGIYEYAYSIQKVLIKELI